MTENILLEGRTYYDCDYSNKSYKHMREHLFEIRLAYNPLSKHIHTSIHLPKSRRTSRWTPCRSAKNAKK